MKHNFHFVATEELKNKIYDYSIRINKTRSDTISILIKKTYPVIKNFIMEFNNDDNLNYEKINAEYQIHAEIDKEDYNILGLIQTNMGLFSKALILRKILELSLNKIKKYGAKRFNRIMERYRLKFQNKIKSIKIFNKKTNIHMYRRKNEISIFLFEYTNFYELSKIKIINFE